MTQWLGGFRLANLIRVTTFPLRPVVSSRKLTWEASTGLTGVSGLTCGFRMTVVEVPGFAGLAAHTALLARLANALCVSDAESY